MIGLSTHLLARHRKALDDYYMDSSTKRLVVKPHDWVMSHGAKQSDPKKKQDEPSFDSTAMANLASAAAQRSAADSISSGGDGLWLVQKFQADDDNDSDDTSEGNSDLGSTEVIPTINNKYNETNDALNSLANIVENEKALPVEPTVENTLSSPVALPIDGSLSGAESDVAKLDRRKYNHGVKQRKSYR